MKKNRLLFILTVLIMCFLFAPMNAFSSDGNWTVAADGDEEILLGDTDQVSVSLSTNVEAFYEDGGSGLWYSIATSHTQGTRTYATAQETTGILFVESLTTDPPDPASSTDWSTGSWEKL